MNKPLTLIDALKGKTSPIAHLRWHLVCNCCGRDLGYCGGYPKTINCYECEQPLTYEDNPEFVGTTTSTEISTVPTGDLRFGIASKQRPASQARR